METTIFHKDFESHHDCERSQTGNYDSNCCPEQPQAIGPEYVINTILTHDVIPSSRLTALARTFSLALLSCPHAAMMSRPRGVRTGLA